MAGTHFLRVRLAPLSCERDGRGLQCDRLRAGSSRRREDARERHARNEEVRAGSSGGTGGGAALGQRNVVTVFDVGEHDGRRSSSWSTSRAGPCTNGFGGELNPPRALSWLGEAAGALDARMRGVVHRDVKPANLLPRPRRQRSRTGDFGIGVHALGRHADPAGNCSGDGRLPLARAGARRAPRLETGTRRGRRRAADRPPAVRGRHPRNRGVRAPQCPCRARRRSTPAARGVDEVLGELSQRDPEDRPATSRGFVAELREACGAATKTSQPPHAGGRLRPPARRSQPKPTN